MSSSHSIYLVWLFIWLHAHLLFSRFLFFSCCLIEICFSFNLKSVSSLQCGPVCLPSCFCVFMGHMVFGLRHLWLFILKKDEQPIWMWFFPPEQGEWSLPGVPHVLFGWISSRSSSTSSTRAAETQEFLEERLPVCMKPLCLLPQLGIVGVGRGSAPFLGAEMSFWSHWPRFTAHLAF